MTSFQEELSEDEKYGVWCFNSKALLVDILSWKKKYISVQRNKNPDICQEELIKKIKKAKYKKFKDRAYFLLDNHPNLLKLQSVYD